MKPSKYFAVVLFFLLSLYPVQTGLADRQETCLNGEWDFQPVAGQGSLKELPKGNWSETKIRVPSSWADPRKEWEYPDSFRDTNRAYYRRTFDLPEDITGKRILVQFGAIYFASHVWVNGKEVSETKLAPVPYEFDITSAVKSGAGNEVIVGVQGPDVLVENGHAVLPAGAADYYSGLMDDVILKVVPAVYISDVFVMTSVRNGKLTAQIEITNPTDKTFTGTLQCDALALTGAPAKSLPEVAVNVPAEQTATVSAETAWPDAKLWWPSDPQLYKLRARLRGANDVDETCTRFGFREFWCDGPDFKLNGKRVRLIQSATLSSGSIHGSIMQPEYMRAKWALMKETHVGIDRVHAVPLPQVVYDTADEFGMPLIAEGCYAPWGVAGVDGLYGNLEDADKYGLRYNVGKYPELWKEYYRRWIRAYRNHPSIFMWSLFNEMSWDDVLKPLILDPARQMDPTRPMYCDGAGDGVAIGSDDRMMTPGLVGPEARNFGERFADMNGLGDLLTCHYGFPARTDVQSTDNPSYRFPEACYYLDGIDIHKSRTSGEIKPACKGEYSFIWCANPDWISFYGGDRAYQGVWAINDPSRPGFWQVYGQIGRDEGHGLRYAGVNTLCWWNGSLTSLAANGTLNIKHEFHWDRLDTPGFKPWRTGSFLLQMDPWSNPENPRYIKTAVWPYLCDIQDPKLVLLVDAARTFQSGQKISRRFALFNETLEDANDAKAVWSLNQGDKKLLGGEIPVKVEHGRTYKGTVELTLPEVQTPTPVTFTVRWIVSGEEWNNRSQEWEILPPFTPQLHKGRPLYCYDPQHTVDAVLKALGQPTQSVSDSVPKGKDFSLLIAPNALDDRAFELVKKAMQQGVNVAVLDQQKWPDAFVKFFGTKADPGTRSMAFVRNPNHPILEGVNREIHLGHWGPGGQVAEWVLEKPARGSFRDIVYADRDNSMLMEIRGPGAGSCILTTLQLAAWSDASPSARRILANLIDYLFTAGEWKHHPALLLADEKSSLREAMEHMNVRTTETSDSTAPILVDGRKAIDEKNLALLREQLDAGGSVYIHGLTPESLKSFGDLLSPIELESTGATGSQNFEIASFDPLTANLSGRDVYFATMRRQMAPFVLKRSSLPKDAVIVVTEPEWTGGYPGQYLNAHEIGLGGKFKLSEKWNVEECKIPGAAMAVIPCRKGKIIIGQLVWDEVFVFRNAANVGLSILNGLGVDMTASPKPATYDEKRFAMQDIRPVCNTTFADDTADNDKKGGWGDQGEWNDLRSLPPGVLVSHAVPFRILDEKPDGRNTCLLLWSSQVTHGARSAEIRSNVKCARLHFLHASIWTGGAEAKYVVHYRDGTAVDIPIRNGYEIDNWWVGCNSQAADAKIGWTGSNPSRDPVGLWHFTWTNSRPNDEIEKISFHASDQSTSSVGLAAVTAELPVPPADSADKGAAK